VTGTWASGWATGDIEVAAEFKKGIGSIFDTTLGASAANVDVTSISATYAHLLVVIYARGDNASVNTGIQIRFNGDSAANYDYQLMRAAGATVSNVAEGFGQTSASMGLCPANTAGANLFGAQVVFIPHYAGASNNKVLVLVSSHKYGTSTTNIIAELDAGFWRSNAAINRITLLPAAGNFVTGTRVTVYGMGA
jgi:hypothetical protein